MPHELAPVCNPTLHAAAGRDPSPHRPGAAEDKGSPGGQAVRNSPPGPKTQIGSPPGAALLMSVTRPAIHERKLSATRRSMFHLCDLCSVFSMTERKPNVKRLLSENVRVAAPPSQFRTAPRPACPLAAQRPHPPTPGGIGPPSAPNRPQILPIDRCGNMGDSNLLRWETRNAPWGPKPRFRPGGGTDEVPGSG